MATSGYILSEEHKALAQVLAEISFARYKNNQGHYRNLFNSHLVGRLGEFAAFTLLHELGTNPIINAGTKDGDKLADIHTDFARVEVKTCQPSSGMNMVVVFLFPNWLPFVRRQTSSCGVPLMM